MYQFEIFSRIGIRGRRWYFRFVSANGQIMAQSEGYTRKENCEKAVQSIKRQAAPVPWSFNGCCAPGGVALL